MKKYLAVAVTTLFFLLFMSAMVFFMLFRDASSEKELLTSGDNPDGVLLYTEDAQDIIKEEEILPGKEGFFCIPLPEGTAKDDIRIDDRPSEEMSVISIPLTEADYYYKHNLFGSRERITRIGSDIADGKVIFEIHTEGICVMTAQIEDRCLYIRYDSPADVYEKVILVDPSHGGEDTGSVAYGIREKDIVYGIAEKISVSADTSTGVFFTRTGDVMVSAKEREDFAKKLEPDLMITLHTNADDSTRITRGVEIYYNDGKLKERSEKLADDLCRITGSSEKTVMKKKKISGYENMTVPCIYVGAGFITNRSEAQRMAEDEYGELVAKALEETF